MDTRSACLAGQATERLFSAAQQLDESPDQMRLCERVMQAVWRQLVALSGPGAATALLGQAILETSRNWPMVGHLKATSGGIDTSALRQFCAPSDCELLCEACKSVVSDCLRVVITLSGKEITMALAKQAEAEILGLATGPPTPEPPEEPESCEDISAA